DRPHLDAAHARRRNLGGQLDRLVEVPGIDEIEPGELLLRLGERAVGHRHPAVTHPHGGRGVNGLKGLRREVVTILPQRIAAGLALAVTDAVQVLLVEVDKAQVLHSGLPVMVERCVTESSVSFKPYRMPVQRSSRYRASSLDRCPWTNSTAPPVPLGTMVTVTSDATGARGVRSVNARRRCGTISTYRPVNASVAARCRSAKRNDPPTHASMRTSVIGADAVANSHSPAIS